MSFDYLCILLGVWFPFFCSRGWRLGYVVDDVVRVKNMDAIRKEFKWNWPHIKGYLTNGFYGAGLFQNRVVDHYSQLLVHLVNCVLLYSIVGGQVGLMAALLYMLNPVNNQTTLWLNGRRYSLTILAVLLSWKFKLLGIVLFPFAAWLHVSGIAFPLLYASSPEWWVIPIGVLAVLVCGWKRIKGVLQSRVADFNSNNYYGKNECQRIHAKKLILYVKSLGWYVGHILCPLKPRMFHEFLYYFSRYKEGVEKGYALDKEFLVGACSLIFLVNQIVSGTSSAFWAIWFLVFISQWCNIYNATMHTADRYCSLAGIGLMVILSQKILLIPTEVGQAVAFTVIFMFYSMKYSPLFRAYSQYGDFLRYHIWIEPSGVEARNIMALDYLNGTKPNPMSAYAVLRDGLRLRPYDFKLLLLMAQVMFTIGQVEAGHKMLDKAEQMVPLGDEEDCKVEFAKARARFPLQPKFQQGPIQKPGNKTFNAHLATTPR